MARVLVRNRNPEKARGTANDVDEKKSSHLGGSRRPTHKRPEDMENERKIRVQIPKKFKLSILFSPIIIEGFLIVRSRASCHIAKMARIFLAIARSCEALDQVAEQWFLVC